MSARRPTLDEPVIVDQFWKNRRHDAIVTSLSTYEGKNLVDVRMHAMKDGRLVPTPKGVAVVMLRLPDLVKAVNKALAKARALGLLDDDGKPDDAPAPGEGLFTDHANGEAPRG